MADIKQQGLWYEELIEGMTVETRGRTVTEADIVNYAGISGDFNPMHTDAEFATKTPYGKRIAHGALGLSIAIGLLYQTGFMEGTIMAFVGVEWKFKEPVYIGDTIKVTAKVSGKRDMPSAGGGLVMFDIKVIKQDGKVAHKGELTIMMQSKAAVEKAKESQPA